MRLTRVTNEHIVQLGRLVQVSSVQLTCCEQTVISQHYVE